MTVPVPMVIIIVMIVMIVHVGAVAVFGLYGRVADAVAGGQALLDGADRCVGVRSFVEAGMQRRHVP